MNITGKLFIGSEQSIDTADMIGAFAGEECRGVTEIAYVENYDDYFVFFTVKNGDI